MEYIQKSTLFRPLALCFKFKDILDFTLLLLIALQFETQFLEIYFPPEVQIAC